MKTKFLFLVIILIYNTSYSQNEAANWYFGDKAGITFNSGNPVALLNGQLITREEIGRAHV